jgi:hypothetical protein
MGGKKARGTGGSHSHKLSQSIKTKSSSRHVMNLHGNNSKSINLPKLDRIIYKNGVSKIPITGGNHEKDRIGHLNLNHQPQHLNSNSNSKPSYKIDSSILKI